MLKKVLISIIMLLVALNAESRSIKVLIIDDVFQNIPRKDEKLERMGKLRGDLLVNGNHYLGDIEVWKGAAGLYLINELPLEEYVKNVVSSEVGINWEMEALKAQAVIARTYALYQINLKNNTNYDLTSSVLHQVYKGSTIDPRISYSVMNTEGEVLFYNGKLIESLYHSTCGGRTENPDEVFGKNYPYLKSVESSCEISPYWIWERKIPIEEIEKALNIKGLTDISIKSYTSSKRVKTVDIAHSSGTLTIKTNDLRKSLGWNRLPSTNFTITRDNGIIVFEGKGYGHGVGLCQWSALEMARNGKNYKEILAFFYPGTTIQIYENR
ncbi:MAG: SpoIID/LytB domain-containing protein [Nitrospirota bacterium]